MDDLAALLDPDLILPIDGRQFRVRCSARQGLRVTRLVALGMDLDDDAERAEILTMLGDSHEEMRQAGISWPRIAFAGRTAILHYGHSADLAAKYWSAGGVPGNPMPPSPRQKAMGDKLRNLFRSTASATASAGERSPASLALTTPRIPVGDRTTRSPVSVNGTKTNRKQRRLRRGR